LLLSLLPPSCIGASVREVANIHFSNSASSITHFPIAQLSSNINMDIVILSEEDLLSQTKLLQEIH